MLLKIISYDRQIIISYGHRDFEVLTSYHLQNGNVKSP